MELRICEQITMWLYYNYIPNIKIVFVVGYVREFRCTQRAVKIDGHK